MLFLDFTHFESETANETIERYETALRNCLDRGVIVDANMDADRTSCGAVQVSQAKLSTFARGHKAYT